jgi:hypothetical protein
MGCFAHPTPDIHAMSVFDPKRTFSVGRSGRREHSAEPGSLKFTYIKAQLCCASASDRNSWG